MKPLLLFLVTFSTLPSKTYHIGLGGGGLSEAEHGGPREGKGEKSKFLSLLRPRTEKKNKNNQRQDGSPNE